MRKPFTLALLATAAIVACVPSKPPATPKPVPPSVSIDLQLYCGTNPAIDREVYLDNAAGNQSQRSNIDGWLRFVVPASLKTATLRVNDKGECFRLDRDLALSGLDSQPAIVVRLPLKPPPFISGGEKGRVRVDGEKFVREDGSTFQWRGATDFELYRKYLRGINLGPVLDQRAGAGANVLRVLGMFDWRFDDQGHVVAPDRYLGVTAEGDAYYAKLSAFLAMLYDRGLRAEWSAWGDGAQLTTRGQQQAHIDRLASIFTNAPNVFLEVSNEPDGDKNIVGGGDRAHELGASVRGRGFPIANGDYRLSIYATSFHALDYVTVHTDRGPEWMRKSKELQDWRSGFGWNDPATGAHVADFPGLRRPIVGDEPTGVDEQRNGDSRTDDADEAAQYAGICALFGAGCTFHSEAGTMSDLWGPKQLAAAKAFYWAMKWVPVEAVFAPYQAGRGEGGPGIGDMPVEHIGDVTAAGVFRPEGAVRIFAKQAGGFEWVIAAKPGPVFRFVPRRGCTIVDEPRRGFAKLTCPNSATR